MALQVLRTNRDRIRIPRRLNSPVSAVIYHQLCQHNTKAVEQDQQEHKCPNEWHDGAEDRKHQRLQRRTVPKEAHDSDRTLVQLGIH